MPADNRLAAPPARTMRRRGFTYAADGEPAGTAMGFVKPGQSAPWLTNSIHIRLDELGVPQEIVDHQAFADGQSYSYTYDFSPLARATGTRPSPAAPTPTRSASARRSSYAWPLAPAPALSAAAPAGAPPCSPLDAGREINDPSFVYQQTPGPVAISDPLGRNHALRLLRPGGDGRASLDRAEPLRRPPVAQYVIDPEGIRTDLKYDGNRNVIEATRHPSRACSTRTERPRRRSSPRPSTSPPWSKSANKPLSMTDARGNATTWTYAPEHGGVLTETGPAVDGVAPQKRYSYVQRTPASPTEAPAGPPVWLLDRMSTCRTGNPGRRRLRARRRPTRW